MDSRQFLVAIGAVRVAGCSGTSGEENTTTTAISETPQTTDATVPTTSTTRVTERSTATEAPTPTETESPTDTESPTETPRCPGQGAKKLPLGESTRYRNWEFAVTSVELTRSYRLDGEDRTRTLPDGKQFVIVTVDAANRGSERRIWWFDAGFTLVGTDCTVLDRAWYLSFEDDFYFYTHQLQRVKDVNRYRPEVGYPFDPARRPGCGTPR